MRAIRVGVPNFSSRISIQKKHLEEGSGGRIRREANLIAIHFPPFNGFGDNGFMNTYSTSINIGSRLKRKA